jgi:esterase
MSERVSEANLPLAHALVTSSAPGVRSPDFYMLFLHGVFGTGANWRSFARRFVDVAGPFGWGAVLVDMRLHGGSGAFANRPPHTIPSAANDIAELETALPGPVAGIVGHSLGGKIALEYVRLRGGDLDAAWILDATPSARPTGRGSEGIAKILDALTRLGPTWPSRDAFIAELVAEGIAHDLGAWLAMNLRRDDDVYRFRLDLDAIRALLADYWVTDLWSVLESPKGRVVTHVVVGGKSNVFDDGDRARLARASQSPSDVRVKHHVLENAGHWVHVDDPDGLFALIAGGNGDPRR